MRYISTTLYLLFSSEKAVWKLGVHRQLTNRISNPFHDRKNILVCLNPHLQMIWSLWYYLDNSLNSFDLSMAYSKSKLQDVYDAFRFKTNRDTDWKICFDSPWDVSRLDKKVFKAHRSPIYRLRSIHSITYKGDKTIKGTAFETTIRILSPISLTDEYNLHSISNDWKSQASRART